MLKWHNNKIMNWILLWSQHLLFSDTLENSLLYFWDLINLSNSFLFSFYLFRFPFIFPFPFVFLFAFPFSFYAFLHFIEVLLLHFLFLLSYLYIYHFASFFPSSILSFIFCDYGLLFQLLNNWFHPYLKRLPLQLEI